MSAWLPAGAVDDGDVLALVRAAGGAPMAERLVAQASAGGRAAPGSAWPKAPPATSPADFDVVVLGGGLTLLLAQALARAGLRVAVVERQREVAAQRAWNASWPELTCLVTAGVVGAAELAGWVVARYRAGVCRWHGAGATQVTGVLDCAVDAERLLAHGRAALLAAGGTLLTARTAGPLAADDQGVGVWLSSAAGIERLGARVVVDGRGAASPFARHDLVCPTVGGIVSGLEQGEGAGAFDPEVGEILATTEGIDDGRQHVWELFPGRPGEAAVYLFYYAMAGEVDGRALWPLYRRFLARLAGYKRGRAALVRPTFGLIPGWSRLSRGARAPHPRVVLAGDAAGRHSPLTFCGFGAFLRALGPLVATVRARLGGLGHGPGAEPPAPEAALHVGTGALAALMARLPAQAGVPPAALNRLLGAAFAQLEAMGPAAYRGLLQDTLPPRGLVAFLWGTSRRCPEVYRLMVEALGGARVATWSARMAWAAAVGGRPAA